MVIYWAIRTFYFIFKLYIIVLVLPNIKMNPPQVYMCSPSWTLLPPPPHSIPLGRPSARSSIVHRTWTGNSFHTWYFTCFNAILPNLPTLSLSHRVNKTVLYISVSLAISYSGLLLPSFKVPYICVSILYWCFSFWLTSLCIIGSSFIHLIRTDSNVSSTSLELIQMYYF